MLGFEMTSAGRDKSDAADGLQKHDTNWWLHRINLASLISNLEENLIDRDKAVRIIKAMRSVEDASEKGELPKFNTYIHFEPEILKRAGMDCSVMHVGRSSQDILATVEFGLNKERIAAAVEQIARIQKSLCDLAERESGKVVPAYTNGVQALPESYSHYILAFARAFSRETERFIQCFSRYDVCPMGAGVLNGTAWPLNRKRIADLLGFAAPSENSFDAGQIAGNTLPLELSQIVVSVMTLISEFLADFSAQYHHSYPWVVLDLSGSTYVSSAMPQKRNPGFVNDLRRDCSFVTSEAISWLLRLQNLPTGMPDERDEPLINELFKDVKSVLGRFDRVVNGLRVKEENALKEIASDWTCTQEIADRFVLKGIDFRTGHGFASSLVTWARAYSKTPETTFYEEVCEIWKDFQKERAEMPFPLSEEEFKAALNPRAIVEGRQTAGSCSAEEVRKLLKTERNHIEDAASFVQRFTESQETFLKTLDQAAKEIGGGND
ncbi:lyase family protein [Parasutterella excrementihominis]|jgi:argininosuccinate lyase|uniref:lyase family protein n=1 Tax=Parasutterella excrementihominis TaxID=487175 RepID=UPI00248CFD10|nr:lyase family protein [Parasutterella excrementihominis]